MPPESSDTRAEEEPTASGARSEDAARLLVTGYVDKVVDETTKWLKESADAFNNCIEKALGSRYTVDELVKDTTDMWVRNLKYLTSLAAVGPPRDPSASFTSRSSSGTTPSATPPGSPEA